MIQCKIILCIKSRIERETRQTEEEEEAERSQARQGRGVKPELEEQGINVVL